MSEKTETTSTAFPWHLHAGRYADENGWTSAILSTAWSSNRGSYTRLDHALRAFCYGRRAKNDNRPRYDWGEVLEASKPAEKLGHEWHLPYTVPTDFELDLGIVRQISVARCARVSYFANTEYGEPMQSVDIAADVALFKRLLDSGHWSPFEHVATPSQNPSIRSGNFRGWLQFRKEFRNECR